VCLGLCTTSVDNTTQNSSDNLPSYLQTNIIAQMLSIGRKMVKIPRTLTVLTQYYWEWQVTTNVNVPELRTVLSVGSQSVELVHWSLVHFALTSRGDGRRQWIRSLFFLASCWVAVPSRSAVQYTLHYIQRHGSLLTFWRFTNRIIITRVVP